MVLQDGPVGGVEPLELQPLAVEELVQLLAVQREHELAAQLSPTRELR